jgi:hypothetical protein
MNTVLLSSIVAATIGGGFMYCQTADVAELLQHQLVEQNAAIVDENGAVATRATDAGIAYVNNMNSQAQANTQAAPAAAAPVQTQAPVTASQPTGAMTATQASFARAMFKPPVKEKGSRVVAEKYPFGDLKAPNPDGSCDAFFVAKSADVPEPNKTLTSAASAANRRYAEKVGEKTVNGKTRAEYKYSRKFEVFDGTSDHTPNGAPGVWVARTL